MRSSNLFSVFTVVLSFTVCCSTSHAATIFFDDFSDGDPLDGSPVSWIQDDEPDDVMTIVNGDLVITSGGSTYAGYGFASPQGVSLSDVSVRVQARTGSGDLLALAARVDEPLTGDVPQGGYWGRITAGGEVAMGGFGEYLGGAPFPTDFRPDQEDVMMQLDIIGNQLSFWVWRPGENMPQEPLLTATDNRDNSGVIGLSVWNWPWSNAPTEATFRYAHVADSHIPAPSADFDQDGKIDGLDFLTWQRNVGVATGATKAQGDADDNGTVDSMDLAVWNFQYGTVPPLSASSREVPEPTACFLAQVALLLATFGRRPIMQTGRR